MFIKAWSWTKDKVSRAYCWTKDKARRFWYWIIGAGVVYAITQIAEEEVNQIIYFD